ncbi:MAG: shikimate kinase [Lachnospiraceae bacterium]|nr:shikimate kinase [Lachnospiraceae bacterium]
MATGHKKNKEYNKGPHLILIGFMGSGKTSIGRGLSYKLQRAFCDTDKMIEAGENMTVSEIFRSKGEGAFRMMETELLRTIRDDTSPKIYSLGGGTPVQLQNQPLIKMCGTVVYLRITPEAVYERLKGDKTRPLLQCDDPFAKIRDLMAVRTPAYERCADIIVDTGDTEREDVMEDILEKLKEAGWKIPEVRKTEKESDEDTGDKRSQS